MSGSQYVHNKGSIGTAGDMQYASPNSYVYDDAPVTGLNGYQMGMVKWHNSNTGLPHVPFETTVVSFGSYSKFLLSGWIDYQGQTAAYPGLLGIGDAGVGLMIRPASGFATLFVGNGTQLNEYAVTLPGGTLTTGLHHFIATGDNDAQTFAIAMDGSALPVDFTTFAWTGNIPANTDDDAATLNLDSDRLGDFWFAPTASYMPLSPSLIAAFYRGGLPVYLGADGSLPLGQQPALFFSTGSLPASRPPLLIALGQRDPSPQSTGVS